MASEQLPRAQRAKNDTTSAPAREQHAPGPEAPRATINTGLPPHSAGESPERETTRLELPHERDQNLQGTRAQPSPVIEQAAKDLEEGQVDTDMRTTPGLDAERREQLTGRKSAVRR